MNNVVSSTNASLLARTAPKVEYGLIGATGIKNSENKKTTKEVKIYKILEGK